MGAANKPRRRLTSFAALMARVASATAFLAAWEEGEIDDSGKAPPAGGTRALEPRFGDTRCSFDLSNGCSTWLLVEGDILDDDLASLSR